MGDTDQPLRAFEQVSRAGPSVIDSHPVLASAALGCAVLAAAILVWFLWRRPELTGQVKVLLMLGIGVLPIGSAMTGNLAGFEHTKHRNFCGSCHVMKPYELDAENLLSTSLPALHARNEAFGRDNCYECHQDYGAFSTVMTKIGGLRHVYEYYTHYHAIPVEEAYESIALYKPLTNASCMRCHSTTGKSWLSVGDHRSSLSAVRTGRTSCVSEGCHGPAHAFSKPARARAELEHPP
jgi:nitrate/TMAO reductase-like tetraheme cytochrome c subunit